MTKKKYLKTIEEILALKDTNTKIYEEGYEKDYHQFINGVLCSYTSIGSIYYNSVLELSSNNYYILEEEPVKEADENDIGKLCWFWDSNEDWRFPGVLTEIDTDNDYSFCCRAAGYFSNCCRLSPSEVAEITGYKVEE